MNSRLNTQTTTEIEALLNRFLTTWNAKDLMGFMENFDENAIFTDVVSQTAIGKNAIMKQHEFAFNVVMKNASFEMKNILMRDLTKDVILVNANWKNINSQTPDGKQLPARHGAIQFAMIKDGKGNWKFKDVHNSDFALPYEKQERVLR